MKKPPRNWKDIKCQKILKCGSRCRGVAIKGNYIAVGVPNCIELYDRYNTRLLYTIKVSGDLPGVTFYGPEHILVSNTFDSSIKMVTIQGQHVRTIDRGSATFEPKGITISPDGHIFVCNGAYDCVCVFDVNGKFLFSFGSHGSGDECFDCPGDLCFASDGFLYITDVGNCRICVYDKDGKFIRKFTTVYQPTCIDATDCGHLIISSYRYDKVMIYTIGGFFDHVIEERGGQLGQLIRPFGVSVDDDGLIYIVDQGNCRIQVF